MEKNSTKGYATLIGKMEETVKSELNVRIVELSKKGHDAFMARCSENYAKLSKLGSAQRVNKLGSMIEEFRALNTELVGLSVDSLYAHIAWLRKIQELEWKGLKNINVTFPLIEDIRMEVAHKYGMIQPGASNTQAVRAVFVIDPKGIIRTILYYPLSTGRNFDEIKRIILIISDANL